MLVTMAIAEIDKIGPSPGGLTTGKGIPRFFVSKVRLEHLTVGDLEADPYTTAPPGPSPSSISLCSKGLLAKTVQRFLVAVQCNQRPFASMK